MPEINMPPELLDKMTVEQKKCVQALTRALNALVNIHKYTSQKRITIGEIETYIVVEIEAINKLFKGDANAGTGNNNSTKH